MIDEEKITIEEEMIAETAPQKPSRILMVVTNACEFNDKDHTKTGVWFEEFAVPYNEFKKNDISIPFNQLDVNFFQEGKRTGNKPEQLGIGKITKVKKSISSDKSQTENTVRKSKTTTDKTTSKDRRNS